MQSLRWILWNLSLAFIPVVLGWLLAKGVETWTLRGKKVPWIVWLPLALTWLAFLPNTCYLLTEWRHFLFDEHFVSTRVQTENNPVLMLSVARQGLFFLVYSAIGILCFALAIRPVKELLKKAHLAPAFWAIPFFILTSLGVYLGLIKRYNSWDILHRPRTVWNASVQAFSTPLLLETILVFAALLWIIYLIVDIWLDGVALRLRAPARARA